MTSKHRMPSLLLPLLLAGLAHGCTAFDDYLPGTPFTTEQPTGEVTVVGAVNADRVDERTDTCSPGGTLFWGTARNTGDLPVDDVVIVVEAFGAGDAFLGSFPTSVFSGEVTELDTGGGTGGEGSAPSFSLASTSLEVDQSGAFSVCTGLPFGSVARTAYRAEFAVVEPLQEQ